MERENTENSTVHMSNCGKDNEENVALPGFRFHPTDEELVGFYLYRKVESKPLSFELIKQVDIYKFDPWDLPKPSSVRDKEGYFFCKRGRKYRNSMRPNRVTGSGFWKATGIDKPIYSARGECIGLKKTLVYYRGSAGKGTKTDWMMHEFRLPATDRINTTNTDVNVLNPTKSPTHQEAEVWTLCRIFKRNESYRKYTPDWRALSNKCQANETSSTNTCSTKDSNRETYMRFNNPTESKQFQVKQWSFISPQPSLSIASSSNVPVSPHGNEMFANAHWDELRSVVDCAFNQSNFM